MDLLGALRIAVRRWYILASLVVLSVLGSLAVRDQVKPSYDIDGVLPIVGPYVSTQEAADQLNRNNFLDLGTTSSVMASLGDSAEIRRTVEVQGGDPDYEIAAESGALTIAVSTDSLERALATYRLVGAELDARLDNLQSSTGVPVAFRVTISDALQPTGALASTTGSTRAMIASLGLGLVMSLAICVFADFLLARRQRRASSEPPDPTRGAGERSAADSRDDNHGTMQAPPERALGGAPGPASRTYLQQGCG